MSAIAIKNSSELSDKLNPQKFALWIGMASILMFFGAFTSAYIVKQGAGNWLEYNVPIAFFISTAIILISSLTLHLSYKGYLKGDEQRYKVGLVASLVLGIGFICFQYIGWNEMFAQGVDLKVNVAGSFFYIITGFHAAHVLGGIATLVVANLHAFTLPYEIKQKRKNRFELVLHYWHFVDALWIYLFIFLIIVK